MMARWAKLLDTGIAIDPVQFSCETARDTPEFRGTAVTSPPKVPQVPMNGNEPYTAEAISEATHWPGAAASSAESAA